LAAGSPVLTTPLSVFSDLSGVVHQLPGINAWEIAEGMVSFFRNEHDRSEILQRQRNWVQGNSWAVQAKRLSNIILGCFEEAQGVELRTPKIARASTAEQGAQKQNSPSSPDADIEAITKLLERRLTTWKVDAPASRIKAMTELAIAGKDTHPAKGPADFLPSFGNDAASLVSRADRARDSGHWGTAAQYYGQALDKRPRNPAIWVQYGHALKESGNLAEAESAYRTALDLDAANADTHLQLGHALKLQGKKIEARAAYFRALVLDPALDHAVFELRALGWTRGRIEFALRRERSQGK
jgi:tetratricopeptide (TPR) repeat protein